MSGKPDAPTSPTHPNPKQPTNPHLQIQPLTLLQKKSCAASAVKRKARGYRSVEYMTTMLYFVAGKLTLPCY